MPNRSQHSFVATIGLIASNEPGSYFYSTGTWRSLVAHLLGVQGVAGSNPAVPTNLKFRYVPVAPRGSEAIGESRCLPHNSQRLCEGAAAGTCLLKSPAVLTNLQNAAIHSLRGRVSVRKSRSVYHTFRIVSEVLPAVNWRSMPGSFWFVSSFRDEPSQLAGCGVSSYKRSGYVRRGESDEPSAYPIDSDGAIHSEKVFFPLVQIKLLGY